MEEVLDMLVSLAVKIVNILNVRRMASYGIPSVEMVSMPLDVAFAHPNVRMV